MIHLLKKYYNLLKKYNLNENGSIKASPSDEPNYNYHWVRDSNLIVSLLVDLYEYLYINNITEIDKYDVLNFIEKFVDFEIVIHNSNQITGLGEPKIHLDGSPFIEPWGRPQNDGPALRIISFIKIIKNFGYLEKKIEPLICENLKYLKENYNKKGYDLWEEIHGFHYYTKIIQLKAFKIVKEYYGFNVDFYIDEIEKIINRFVVDGKIISTIEGNIKRSYLDTSIFMASLHTNSVTHYFNEEMKSGNILIEEFNKIYPINKNSKIKWLGRYPEDIYYGGNPWIITTLAYYLFLYKNFRISKKEILEKLYFIDEILDKNKDSPEQIDKNNLSSKSALFLGWNCAEIIRIIINIDSNI